MTTEKTKHRQISLSDLFKVTRELVVTKAQQKILESLKSPPVHKEIFEFSVENESMLIPDPKRHSSAVCHNSSCFVHLDWNFRSDLT